MNVMIDTQLWVLAKKKPSPSRFPSRDEYKRVLRAHELAREFFAKEYPRSRIYMSIHQMAEIFHALAFRGQRVPVEEARMLLEEIAADPKVVKVPLTLEHYREAASESSRTGIHIWDYLCLLPVKDYVDVVYSTDPHFRELCKSYGLELINPVEYWGES